MNQVTSPELQRAYYSDSIAKFLVTPDSSILGQLTLNHAFALEDLQRNAWVRQIKILKASFGSESHISGHIFFEYAIPRMGKRIDVVLLIGDVVFALEFKIGEKAYPPHAVDQVIDYCLDLKNFHEQSHHCKLVPVLVATDAAEVANEIRANDDSVFLPLFANASNVL